MTVTGEAGIDSRVLRYGKGFRYGVANPIDILTNGASLPSLFDDDWLLGARHGARAVSSACIAFRKTLHDQTTSPRRASRDSGDLLPIKTSRVVVVPSDAPEALPSDAAIVGTVVGLHSCRREGFARVHVRGDDNDETDFYADKASCLAIWSCHGTFTVRHLHADDVFKTLIRADLDLQQENPKP